MRLILLAQICLRFAHADAGLPYPAVPLYADAADAVGSKSVVTEAGNYTSDDFEEAVSEASIPALLPLPAS